MVEQREKIVFYFRFSYVLSLIKMTQICFTHMKMVIEGCEQAQRERKKYASILHLRAILHTLRLA